VIHRPARSRFQILPDGNPQKVPRMVPTRDWAPLFSRPPFHEGNVIGHTRGPGPASLNSGYGSTHRSINYGVPLRKGTGRFSPASGRRSLGSPLAWSLGRGQNASNKTRFACCWSLYHPARRLNDQPMRLAEGLIVLSGVGTSPASRCRDPSEER
jgi:hypothetical protein